MDYYVFKDSNNVLK